MVFSRYDDGHCLFASQLALLPLVAVLLAGGGAAAAETPQPAQKAASAEHIDKLIRQLGDKDYFVRQRAQDELAQLGFEAFDAVSAATNDDDLEIAARAKYLLKLMRVEWTAESDPPNVKQYLRDYESADAAAREERIKALAGLPDGQGTAALCRLVRFERSSLLSQGGGVGACFAARRPPSRPTPPRSQRSTRFWTGCKRPGAVWLLAWTRLGGEPEAVMAEWTRLVDDEQAVVAAERRLETNAEIVGGLDPLSSGPAEETRQDRRGA